MKKKLVLALIVLSLLLPVLPLSALAKTDGDNAYSDITGSWFSEAAAKYGYPEIFKDGSGCSIRTVRSRALSLSGSCTRRSASPSITLPRPTSKMI
jgi:hypothetical protein